MSAWVETCTTPNGKTRYRVKWTLGGRGARRRYGGSFPRKADANARAAWFRSELAHGRIPDRRMVEPEPTVANTLTEDAERWRLSRIDVAEGTAKTYAVNLRRILPVLGPKPTAEVTTEDVQAYLGFTNSGWDIEDLESAYNAEKAAQAHICAVPADDADWPADLVEALCRRVAANLAVRALPLGLQASMTEMAVATSRVGGGDREVDRLESPYRVIAVA